MTTAEMIRGLVRAAEFKEQEDGGTVWDDEVRSALDAARLRGWGKNKVGTLDDESEYPKVTVVARGATKETPTTPEAAPSPAVPEGPGPTCYHCKAKWPCGCRPYGERILATLMEKYPPPDAKTCGTCGGKGYITRTSATGPIHAAGSWKDPCPSCCPQTGETP